MVEQARVEELPPPKSVVSIMTSMEPIVVIPVEKKEVAAATTKGDDDFDSDLFDRYYEKGWEAEDVKPRVNMEKQPRIIEPFFLR